MRKKIKDLVGRILIRIPFLRYAYLYKHNSNFRPGHYYSPVPDIEDIKEREADIWAPKKLHGIDLNEEEQKEFLTWFLANEKGFNIPWKKEPGKRYYGESPSYPYVDGVVLHAMIAKYKPANIMEVGSGSSSGLMIDAKEQYNLPTRFTLIEPEPQHCLDKVVAANEYEKKGVSLIKQKVQKVSPDEFKRLKRNDILFIDSSHVAKPGSDVNYLLTEVLPVLNEGVIIHFHDIYYPFEYSKEYLLELKLMWSEAYCVHNFLLFNNSFKILFFSDYMRLKLHEDALFAKDYPLSSSSLFCNNSIRPKNFWIQKTR